MTPTEMLHAAIMSNGGRIPLRRVCLSGRWKGALSRHVVDRPSVTWCPNCQKIIVRGHGRWWEEEA